MTNQPSDQSWSSPKKVAFRFIFIFFSLFIMASNNGAYPFWDVIFNYPIELLHIFIPWVGKHILQLPYDITVFTNGSGDTTYDYVIVFTAASIAFIGTLIWSVLDRKRPNYKTLYYWLTVAVRFYVGLMLIQYGLVKIIKLQFPSPNFYRLTQSYGDSSPMGLAWTFLGFSKGYNLFMGLAEVAAILLFFRRTMTFGAIITLMTTLNVMAVNYFYDVPVKILSTMLVVMTTFLLAYSIEPLVKFFFTGKAVNLPVIKAPEMNKKWLKVGKWTLKTMIIGYSLVYGFISLQGSRKQYGDMAPKPQLYGLYNVDMYVVNNDTIPPMITDSLRWKQFTIEREGLASVNYMTDNKAWLRTKIDTTAHVIDMTASNDSTMRYLMKYENPDPEKIRLHGTVKEDTISILMSRKDPKDFLLINRGFHWISEYPFNR